MKDDYEPLDGWEDRVSGERCGGEGFLDIGYGDGISTNKEDWGI